MNAVPLNSLFISPFFRTADITKSFDSEATEPNNLICGHLDVSVVESVYTTINPEFGMYSDYPSSESESEMSDSSTTR